MENKFKYVFGPLFSWRLGRSIGIDLVSMPDKICNFNCGYCQLGETVRYQDNREEFVSTEEVLREIIAFPRVDVDYYTFSSSGEPTLAKNLGEVIGELKRIKKEKIAVITNASLIAREDVQKDLLEADYVLAKMDACSQKKFMEVNAPLSEIKFHEIIDGLKSFRLKYQGILALQIMFVESNKDNAEEISGIAKEIDPDEVQINTPLRPSELRPLSKEEIDNILVYFSGFKCKNVYDAEKKYVSPINVEDTKNRHGNSPLIEGK